MKGRERFLTALSNGKPDRLPCQVHDFMRYYLNTYLGGKNALEAYRFLGMDPVLYTGPRYIYDPKDLAKWEERVTEGVNSDGYRVWRKVVTTPKGTLTQQGAENQYTPWVTEQIIKNERDFELWNEFFPIPVGVDWTPVIEAKKAVGEDGIVRGSFFDFGQGSPWQSFVDYLYDTQTAIYDTFDNPDWIHHALKCMLDKKLRVIDLAGKFEFDLVETGGGAGSSTVISPDMHREYCLPYDKRQIAAIQNAGSKVVYHLCGGLMPLLETVVENGTNALETMTPASMGGDCRMEEAAQRVGDKLCFIGGFDQNQGFERNDIAFMEREIHRLHAANPNGGYICCPSDHFFFGEAETLRTFARICAECKY